MISLVLRGLLVLVLIASVACASSSAPDAGLMSVDSGHDAGVGADCDRDACVSGWVSLDCRAGATAEASPRFACGPVDCVWIEGCIPEGFEVSTCPSTDPCCHDGWPFVAEEPNTLRRDHIVTAIQSFGYTPVSRDDESDVVLLVDPSVEMPTEHAAKCEGTVPPPLDALCAVELSHVQLYLLGDSLVVFPTPRSSFASVWLYTEIWSPPGGGWRARFFVRPHSEVASNESQCREPARWLAPTQGTVTVSQLDDPETAYGLIEIPFASGTLRLPFSGTLPMSGNP